MVSIYDVSAQDLILRLKEELKQVKEIQPPQWAPFVKTGVHKDRAPVETDWWYTRVAAVLRSVYKLGPIGVSKLRTKYGGRKNRGHKPDKTFKGSGNILRKVLQQLDAAGLTIQTEKGVHKGRIMTPKGKSMVDKIVVAILKEGVKQSTVEKPKKEGTPKPTQKESDKSTETKPKKEEKVVEPKSEKPVEKETKKEEKKPKSEKPAKEPKEEKNDHE